MVQTPQQMTRAESRTARWRRFGTLLVIPLRPAGALTLVFIAVLVTLMLKAGLFAIPGLLILGTWYFKYSFAFLDALVNGQTEAPVLSIEMIMASLDEFRFLLPLILAIVAFFAFGAARYFVGSIVTALLAIVMLLILPAVVAVQGWTGRLSHSLGPAVCWRMARTLGTDYICALSCIAGLLAIDAVLGFLVPQAPRILQIVLFLYAWLAAIAVIGGALRANREVLSERIPLIIPEIAPPALDEAAHERARWIDAIYGALRANNRDNVWHLVMERVQGVSHPLRELQWLYERIAAWHPVPFPNRVAQEVISRLLAEDREGEALRLVRERVALDSAFRPSNAEEGQRLAQLAERWRDHATAEALKKAFPAAA
ncbi:MAG TPA: hypothetical protein VHX52_07990 [Steroidobacteraceae bacterium]|jgi:hypothetical protein|nr:hypothetical protein [Steroidobacteraceae bacterium]